MFKYERNDLRLDMTAKEELKIRGKGRKLQTMNMIRKLT